MIKNLLHFLSASLFILLVNGCYYDNQQELYPSIITCDTITVTYSQQIAPMLTTNCNSCHSAAAASANGGIVLDSYSKVSEQALSGKLYGVVSHTSGSPMPKGGNMLESCKISQIKKWASAGAPNN